jgi:sugar phosphate isomerase/epimerase
MKFGAYTACLHSKPVEEAVQILADMGLDSAEINSGGFLPPVHIPDAVLDGDAAAIDEYLGLFADKGVTLTALNCNGNPLHADREVADAHADGLRRSIPLAASLGVKRIVTMSGLPGADAGATLPAWSVVPWDSTYLDARDYQWNDVAIPFWKDIQARAADADVKIAIEMHPHNVVYNPATLLRLAEAINATHVGAEMDPSHLMWQGIEPVRAIEALGGLVYNAAAKDVRINDAAKVNGVLDDRFGRVAPDDPDALSLGGRYTLSRWPENASWDFVAVGRGEDFAGRLHDAAYWRDFLRALERVDPDIPVNIEHEDQELDQLEGLRFAARTLLEAAGKVPVG